MLFSFNHVENFPSIFLTDSALNKGFNIFAGNFRSFASIVCAQWKFPVPNSRHYRREKLLSFQREAMNFTLKYVAILEMTRQNVN